MLAGFVDPESPVVQRVLGELQPSFGDIEKQRSVLRLCILGEPNAFLRVAGIVYPLAHGSYTERLAPFFFDGSGM